MAKLKRSLSDIDRSVDNALPVALQDGSGAANPPAYTAAANAPRACVQCHATKTPQWREGPLGPKTLCNACGVKRVRQMKALAESQASAAMSTKVTRSKAGGGRQHDAEPATTAQSLPRSASAELALALQLLSGTPFSQQQQAPSPTEGRPMRASALRAVKRAVQLEQMNSREMMMEMEELQQQEQQAQPRKRHPQPPAQQRGGHQQPPVQQTGGHQQQQQPKQRAERQRQQPHSRSVQQQQQPWDHEHPVPAATMLAAFLAHGGKLEALEPQHQQQLLAAAGLLGSTGECGPTDSGEEICWAPHREQACSEGLGEVEADAVANLLSISRSSPPLQAPAAAAPLPPAAAVRSAAPRGAPPPWARPGWQAAPPPPAPPARAAPKAAAPAALSEDERVWLTQMLGPGVAQLASSLPRPQLMELVKLREMVEVARREAAAADAAVTAVSNILGAKQHAASIAHAAVAAASDALHVQLLQAQQEQEAEMKLVRVLAAAGVLARSGASAAAAAPPTPTLHMPAPAPPGASGVASV